jgi:hypothetical protein
MNEVRVDPDRPPGIYWRQWCGLIDGRRGTSLATTGGLVSSTGVAGFTLGGGIG